MTWVQYWTLGFCVLLIVSLLSIWRSRKQKDIPVKNKTENSEPAFDYHRAYRWRFKVSKINRNGAKQFNSSEVQQHLTQQILDELVDQRAAIEANTHATQELHSYLKKVFG